MTAHLVRQVGSTSKSFDNCFGFEEGKRQNFVWFERTLCSSLPLSLIYIRSLIVDELDIPLFHWDFYIVVLWFILFFSLFNLFFIPQLGQWHGWLWQPRQLWPGLKSARWLSPLVCQPMGSPRVRSNGRRGWKVKPPPRRSATKMGRWPYGATTWWYRAARPTNRGSHASWRTGVRRSQTAWCSMCSVRKRIFLSVKRKVFVVYSKQAGIFKAIKLLIIQDKHNQIQTWFREKSCKKFSTFILGIFHAFIHLHTTVWGLLWVSCATFREKFLRLLFNYWIKTSCTSGLLTGTMN